MSRTNLVAPLATVTLLMVLAPIGLAQSPGSTNPDETPVVISTLRLPQTAAESGVAISVITADTLARRADVFASDALGSVPGVTVTQNGPYGGSAFVRIRGNATGQTLVLVDGVAVNDPSSPAGGFDFGSFELGDVAQIEVLRGPQSTLWGTDAIGGVVSIATRKPERGLSVRNHAEFGSQDTFRAGLGVAGGGQRASGRLSASWIGSDGISRADERLGNSERDGFSGLTLSGKGDVELWDWLKGSVVARWNDTETELDGYDPVTFAFGDTDERVISETFSGAATLDAEFLDGRLGSQLQLAHASIDRQGFAGAAPTSANQGQRTTLRWTGDAKFGAFGRSAFGIEREESEAADLSANATSVFGLYSVQPVTALTLTAGLRHDDDDRYGSATTAKIAGALKVSPQLALRATWGQGFKAPTIFQSTYVCTFCGLSAPNADLEAETSEGFDAGLDWADAGAAASLTLFVQETEQLIDFSFSAGYANIAFAKQQGAELAASLDVSDWLSLAASYAYIETEDGTGTELLRVPKHSGSVELIADPHGPLSGSLAIRHNGDQPDVDANTFASISLDAWTRADLALSYAVTPSAEAYARIENLTDESYQSISGYGTLGRSLRVGFRWAN